MSLHTHLATIEQKHGKLETMIDNESHRPSPDFTVLRTLKKQKLLIKEEMERIRTQERQRLDAA